MSIRHYYKYPRSAKRKVRPRKKQGATPGRILLVALAIFTFCALVTAVFVPELKTAVWDWIVQSAASAAVSAPAPTPAPDAPASLPTPTPEVYESTLEAWILDCGEGDAALLKGPNGTHMLIDSGPYESRDALVALLRAQNVKTLDMVVSTHPHSDHTGNMAYIIRHYPIGEFYTIDAANDVSAAYTNMVQALAKKELTPHYVWADRERQLYWDDDATVRVLSPYSNVNYGGELNAQSLVLNIRYGNTAILFTGDADVSSEMIALSRQGKEFFRADVIKLGHHGSSDATSALLLAAVAPRYAIASCGLDNNYGHPHETVVKMLAREGITLYRTDKNGTVHIIMDGTNVIIECERL